MFLLSSVEGYIVDSGLVSSESRTSDNYGSSDQHADRFRAHRADCLDGSRRAVRNPVDRRDDVSLHGRGMTLWSLP